MKPKNPKQPPSLPHVHLELNAENTAEMQQVLTFQTVDELLSHDRSETEVPDQVTRRLRKSVPGHSFKTVPPTPPPKSSGKARRDG
jgi:hypothetical protein